jgi:predicted nucleic acid-binding protein
VSYLVDTNHWSYLQEERPGVVAHLRDLPEESALFMSVVSQAELLAGIELVGSERRRQELMFLYQRTVATATEILPITSDIAQQFASIFASLRRKGKPIETNDIWIAATARARGLTVVSSDIHFRHVDGLQVEDWSGGDPQ